MGNLFSRYKDDIIKLYEEGKSCREIVNILNCSSSLVYYYINEVAQEKQKKNNILNHVLRKNIRKQCQKRNRDIVTNYLRGHPCIDCGNSDIRVLEFDHIADDKEISISHAVRNAWSETRLLSEIAKCEIRCCNCHRIITIERRNIHKLS